jgi:hypothetical protein
MPLAAPTLLSAAEKPLRVLGTEVTPAFWKSLVFTVVTRKDESNGIPISLFPVAGELRLADYDRALRDIRVAVLKASGRERS